MIIKNISTRVVRLEDFPDEKPLLPGATVDLSKYSDAERFQSDQLQDLFQRRILMCLGYAPTSKQFSGKRLQATQLTRYRYDTEVEENTVFVPAKQQQGVSAPKMKRELPVPITSPERYNNDALDQYKYELEYEQDEEIPAFEERDFEEAQAHSFVQVQNEDRVLTLTVDEETGATFVDDLQPGQIPTEFATDPSVFVDKSSYTLEETQDTEKQKEILQERLHKRIVARVKKKCLYPRTDGKPCQRNVVPGFDRCFRHFSDAQKTKYYEEKAKKEAEKAKKKKQAD